VSLPADGAHLLPWHDLVAALLLPIAAESIYRGLFYGGLVTSFPIQTRGTRWLLSWPVLLSALLYSLWTAVLRHPGVALVLPPPSGASVPVAALGAVVFGVAAGMARERSESVGSAIFFHWIAVAAVLLLHALGS
jgi:membrane protease YdiL (CAAX protease family)